MRVMRAEEGVGVSKRVAEMPKGIRQKGGTTLSMLGSIRIPLLASGIATLGVLALNPICFAGAIHADDSITRSDSSESSTTTVKEIAQRESIPFTTLRKSTADLRSGTSKTVQAGKAGEKLVKYRVYSKGDEEVNREIVSTSVLRNPTQEIVKVGTAAPKRFGSRGGYFSGGKVISMIATGYTGSAAENGGNSSGRSATGLKIGHGVVAVDPNFIPLGTRLYIEGYGYAVAADTGGAIKGNRIDLGHDTHREANQVGRRSVKVHILD
jgi:3D (Asp-Asp-Asp) domain-containing protein